MNKIILAIIIVTLGVVPSFSKIKGKLKYETHVEPKECWKAMEKRKFLGIRINIS